MSEVIPVQNSKTSASGRSRAKRRNPHVITITSGKGGVGKTNITANLAYILRQLRRRVMIMDADLGLANIDIVLGLAPQYNISHVLSGEKRLSDILITGPAGIEILPASSGVVESTNISEQQKLMLLEQLEELETNFDYLLIDTEAGISNNVVYFALAAQTTVVIVTPEPTSLADAYALIKVLSSTYRQSEFRVLLNEVSGEYEALEVFKQLTNVTDRFLDVSIDYLGFVPRDPRVGESVRAQKPFCELYPGGAAAKALKEVAREIISMENKPLKSDLGLLWRNMLMSPAA